MIQIEYKLYSTVKNAQGNYDSVKGSALVGTWAEVDKAKTDFYMKSKNAGLDWFQAVEVVEVVAAS